MQTSQFFLVNRFLIHTIYLRNICKSFILTNRKPRKLEPMKKFKIKIQNELRKYSYKFLILDLFQLLLTKLQCSIIFKGVMIKRWTSSYLIRCVMR